MNRRVEIGRYAPMPRPTARRLSDLNPYARLSAPRDPDRIVGLGLGVVAAVLVAALLAGVIVL